MVKSVQDVCTDILLQLNSATNAARIIIEKKIADIGAVGTKEIKERRQLLVKQYFETLIDNCYDQAFNTILEKDRGHLFKKLVIIMHEDKLTGSTEPFILYLKENNLISMPQCILNRYKDGKPITNSDASIWFNHFNQIACPISWQVRFWGALQSTIIQMRSQHVRYPVLLISVVDLIYSLLSTLLPVMIESIAIIGGIALMLLSPIVGGLFVLVSSIEGSLRDIPETFMFSIENGLLNFFTDSEYTDVLYQYSKNEYPSIKEAFINRWVARRTLLLGEPTVAQTLDDIMDQIVVEMTTRPDAQAYPGESKTRADARIDAQARSDIEKNIKNASAYDSVQFKLILMASFNAIQASLLRGPSFSSALLKIIPLTLMSVLALVIVAGIQLTRSILWPIIIELKTCPLYFLHISVLLILNTPLYLLDMCRFITRKTSSLYNTVFKQKEPVDEEADDGISERPSSSAKMASLLMLTDVATISRQNTRSFSATNINVNKLHEKPTVDLETFSLDEALSPLHEPYLKNQIGYF